MPEMNDFRKLVLDMRHNRVEKYSSADAAAALRDELIKANGGSTKLDYKKYVHGEYREVFALLEEILDIATSDKLQNHPYFQNLVEFRSVPLGDQNLFRVRRGNLFHVAEIADGTQGIRRQRIEQETELTIPTKIYGVKIYEELSRVLAGRVDFNHMIDTVADSFAKKLLDDVISLWFNATAADMGGAAYFPAAGSYDEDTLLEVISHVEAEAGMTATIVGTKTALRNLAPAVQGVESANDLYNMGLNVA